MTRALTQSGATRFGDVVAVGDIVSDSSGDIIVGSPMDGGGAGSVYIWRGASSGPVFSTHITGNETDAFGSSIAVANVETGSSKADLVVGAIGEAFGSGPAEGRILVHTGTTDDSLGPVIGSRSQGNFYVAGDEALPEEHRGTDQFGAAIALGQFNGDGYGFAIGAPRNLVDGNTSGAVFTFSPNWEDGRKLDQVTMRHGSAWPPY